MKQFLVVVDMQRDFVDGSLGTREALEIVPEVVKKIRSFNGKIFVTYDTHFETYFGTLEGKKLPVKHCIRMTDGWRLFETVETALQGKNWTMIEKYTFGSLKLPELIKEEAAGEPFSIELCGLCTDICVVSNALILKAYFPEMPISLDGRATAGVTPALRKAAIETMKSCQIDVSE